MSAVMENDQTRAAAAAAPLVRMAEIKGRGRALVASQPLRGGQIVLRDSPILVYSALPLKPQQQQQEGEGYYCSHCFRIILQQGPSTVVSCPTCSASPSPGGGHDLTLFCSPNCRSLALASSHSPWVCQALTRLGDSSSLLLLHQERQVQARFLIAAYNLAVVSPSDFRTLLSLQGEPPAPAPAQPSYDDDDALFLHSLISSLCPPPSPATVNFGFSLELTASLLAKDKLNAFGLMEPAAAEDRERSVRAYGIYPNASFFNHDCLPNACRFDYVDAAAGNNTDIIVRVIHDVPQGREICLSYFPVNENYSQRQRRLREDYGFTCECDRCKVEANWSDLDEEDDELETMDEDWDEHIANSSSDTVGDNDFPHAYFFLRYMCNRKNCWGTLAPLPPPSDSIPSGVMECNVCGNLKNEEEATDGDGDGDDDDDDALDV
uniref:Putative histone-lysine N-methyltransferase ASHR2 n=1 Tax=Davidia involucrata TaxID=16924 RepID=A0A5B7CAE0_DAVIN